MNIAKTAEDIRLYLAPLRQKRIALVATMGCLHAGHISLIQQAKKLADIVVVSIYVNPLQFGPHEDFDRYPKTLEQDIDICKKEGVDAIFHPHSLYPEDGTNITLHVKHINSILCGKTRPSHFDGVATVVNILFNIIQPNISVFGEKDWQQLAIIRRMVSDLHMPIDIVSGQIIREPDGLAMSSRNRYLDIDERQKSLALYQCMHVMKGQPQNTLTPEDIIKVGIDYLNKHDISPEYLEIRNQLTLKPETTLTSQSHIFIAAKIGNTRLIDNLSLTSGMEQTLCN